MVMRPFVQILWLFVIESDEIIMTMWQNAAEALSALPAANTYNPHVELGIPTWKPAGA